MNYQEQGYSFSFDLLGEGATNAKDAVTKIDHKYQELFQRPGLSIKLSVLHPRYEDKHGVRVLNELVPKLQKFLKKAREANIAITIDAEETNRLELSLKVFTKLFDDNELTAWNGLGLAVQAYSKRALPVLRYLSDLATKQ